jgi:hypothetical protein
VAVIIWRILPNGVELKNSRSLRPVNGSWGLPEGSHGSKMSSPFFSTLSHFVTQDQEGAEDPKELSIFAEMVIALWPLSVQYMIQLFSCIIARQEIRYENDLYQIFTTCLPQNSISGCQPSSSFSHRRLSYLAF